MHPNQEHPLYHSTGTCTHTGTNKVATTKSWIRFQTFNPRTVTINVS